MNILSVVASLLIAQLGHTDFRTRERTHRALAAANREYDIRAAIRAATKSTSAEVARRAARIIEDYGCVRPTGVRHMPRLCCVPHRDGDYDYGLARDRASQLYHLSYEESQRYATGWYVAALFRRGLTRRQVIRLLDEAMAKDRELDKYKER